MISPGENPGRCAQEQGEVGDARLDLRDKLDSRCPCPNHRHALARQVIVVIPLRRVELDPLELPNTWNERERWFAERAVAENEKVGSKLTLRGGNVPALAFFVPKASCNLLFQRMWGRMP